MAAMPVLVRHDTQKRRTSSSLPVDDFQSRSLRSLPTYPGPPRVPKQLVPGVPVQAQEGLGRFVDARVVSGVLGCDLAGSLKRDECIVPVPGPELPTRQFDEVMGATFRRHRRWWMPASGLTEHRPPVPNSAVAATSWICTLDEPKAVPQ